MYINNKLETLWLLNPIMCVLATLFAIFIPYFNSVCRKTRLSVLIKRELPQHGIRVSNHFCVLLYLRFKTKQGISGVSVINAVLKLEPPDEALVTPEGPFIISHS